MKADADTNEDFFLGLLDGPCAPLNFDSREVWLGHGDQPGHVDRTALEINQVTSLVTLVPLI